MSQRRASKAPTDQCVQQFRCIHKVAPRAIHEHRAGLECSESFLPMRFLV
jgi:hypothetical protein